MDDHRCLRAFGKAQEVPGMLPLFENPILTDAAPVRGVKNDEGIVAVPIGQGDGSPAFGDAMVPASYHHRIDGLASGVAPMGMLGVLSLARAIVRG